MEQVPIFLFTDFGPSGPYVGQVKAALWRAAPGLPVMDLMDDAPAFSPQAASHLLAALAPFMPVPAVMLCVVDPGVGGDRPPVVVEAAGRFYVGPGNGLLEMVLRRAGGGRMWEILWRPETLSATFHGRDLFAPVAARLALGQSPEQAGCRAIPPQPMPHWPDDLAEIIYIDPYGNAMTGLRAEAMPAGGRLQVAGRILRQARIYVESEPGEAFWYVNSIGLVEIALAGGRADSHLHVERGHRVGIFGP